MRFWRFDDLSIDNSQPMKKYIMRSNKFIFYCLFIIIDAVNVAYMAVLLKQTMDAAIDGDMKQLIKVAVTIICFILEYSLISWGMRTLKAAYFSETMYSIKKDLFTAFIDKNAADFAEKNSAEYLSLFNNDLKLIEEKGIAPLFMILRSVVILVLSLVIMMSIQPLVSVIAILLSALPILIPKIWGKRLSSATEIYTKNLKDYNRTVDDIFKGIRVVRGYELETYMTMRHEKSNHMVKSARRHMEKKKAGVDVVTNFIAVGMQFTVFLISGFFVIWKKITAGDVLAITQLMNKVMNPVFDIIDSLNQMQSVKGIEKELLSYLDKENSEEVLETEVKKNLENISFERVSYSYVPGAEVVSDVSVCFEKGKKYAIVGESGSGKTTLLKLIEGELDNSAGKISYNRADEKWSRKERRRAFCVIDQEVYLFEGTIRDNIVFDNTPEEKTLEKIVEDVKLQETLDKKGTDMWYYLTGNGENLSGGEREKIAIARSLIRGKEWLLLDEATAGMDNETLLSVERMLMNLKGVTCISITHRYYEEILKMYDTILVMQKGKIVEQGNFEQLLKKNGVFAKLYHGLNLKL